MGCSRLSDKGATPRLGGHDQRTPGPVSLLVAIYRNQPRARLDLPTDLRTRPPAVDGLSRAVPDSKKAGKPCFCLVFRPLPDVLGRSIWWRRRESNPRPQVLCRRIYMLIPVYCFNRLLPDGQGKQPAILKGFSGSAPGLPCRELVCVDA